MTEPNEQTEPTAAAPTGALGEMAAALAGTAGITFGMWQIYHPAGFIVGGAFLLTGAWLSARQAAA